MDLVLLTKISLQVFKKVKRLGVSLFNTIKINKSSVKLGVINKKKPFKKRTFIYLEKDLIRC